MSRYDPLLERQIAKVGVVMPADANANAEALLTTEQLQDLFARISVTYARSNEQRDQLAKMVELSKQAMSGVISERDRLTELLVAIGDALFELAGATTRGGHGQAFDQVRHKWTTFLTELLDSDELTEGDPSMVRGAHGVNRGFLAMVEALDLANQRIVADRELQRELTAANALVMPDHGELDLGFLAVAGFSEPVGACGGDFWTVRRLDDGRVLVVVGDATGHGARATVIAAAARAACALVPDGDDTSLLTFCQHANRAVDEIGRSQVMMTWVAGLFDPERREVQVANAGHRLPLLIRGGDPYPVVARGSPLGSALHPDCEPVTVPLRPGDTFVLYSDGMIDAEGPSGDRFSERRLRTAATTHHDSDPRVMRDAMLGELRSFRGRHPRTDDLTLVLAQVRARDSEDPWSSTR